MLSGGFMRTLRATLNQRRFQQFRNTWVLRRVIAPEPTAPGDRQRNPEELPNLMKYEVVEQENLRPADPVKLILLQDVEGIGHQYDIVDVSAKVARLDLLLSKRAVYASPFDLKYYGDVKERMKEELASRIRVPYDYLLVARGLTKHVVSLCVSMESPWVLDAAIFKYSLLRMGVSADGDAIYFDEKVADLSGPNFDHEARLVRFYVVICKQYIVPLIGRISHVSADEKKKVLYPEEPVLPSAKEMLKYGIVKEEPYFHRTADIFGDFDVVGFMRKRIENTSSL